MSEDDAPWANLGLREEAAVFESASQNARVMTEGWVAASLVCPNCGAQPISWFAADRTSIPRLSRSRDGRRS